MALRGRLNSCLLVIVWYAANLVFSLGMKRSHALVPDVVVLTTMQFGVGAASLSVAMALGYVSLPDRRWVQLVLCSAALFFGGTFATNLSLVTLSVSFTHVLKTCEPLFTVVIIWLWDRQLPGATASLSLVVTIVGVLIASLQQRKRKAAGDSIVIGFCMGMLANALLQLRNVLNKRLMQRERPFASDSALSGPLAEAGAPADNFKPVSSPAPPGALALVFLTLGAALPMQLVLHGCADVYLALQPAPPTVSRYAHYGDAHPLWLVVTPAFFVLYQAASLQVLSQVDPVMHAVLNSLKRMLVIGVGAAFMREPLSAGYVAGALLAVAGVACYSLSKTLTSRSAHGKMHAGLACCLLVALPLCSAEEGSLRGVAAAQGSRQLRDGPAMLALSNRTLPAISGKISPLNVHRKDSTQATMQARHRSHLPGGSSTHRPASNRSSPLTARNRVGFVDPNMAICFLLPWGSNFGDEIGPAVVKRIIQTHFDVDSDSLPLYNLQRCYPRNAIGDESRAALKQCTGPRHSRPYVASPHTCFLVLGSILEATQRYYPSDRRPPVIWGAGTHTGAPKQPGRVLTVIATRGPLTYLDLLARGFVFNRPLAYGDPAILIAHLFPEYHRPPKPSKEYCVVPHHNDMNHVAMRGHRHVLSPSCSWHTMVKNLLPCAYVISSSLHGIIVAEAFKIPARWLYLDTNVTEERHYQLRFKYNDYYAATNRTGDDFATNVSEALRMGPKESFDVDALSARLLESFPYQYFKYTS